LQPLMHLVPTQSWVGRQTFNNLQSEEILGVSAVFVVIVSLLSPPANVRLYVIKVDRRLAHLLTPRSALCVKKR
jgi:hypothetical protein